MDDIFEIPVTYKNQDLLLPAQLVVFGYSHRILIWLDDQEIYFEPDEEKNYRAMINPVSADKGRMPDVGLLQVIAAEIEALVR